MKAKKELLQCGHKADSFERHCTWPPLRDHRVLFLKVETVQPCEGIVHHVLVCQLIRGSCSTGKNNLQQLRSMQKFLFSSE